MPFRFSRRAEGDLRKAVAFMARKQPALALTFVYELRRHCHRLAAFPEAAPLRPELGPGVRLSIFGKYLVLYVMHAEFVEIRRIVHGARRRAAPPPSAGSHRTRSGALDAAEGAPRL